MALSPVPDGSNDPIKPYEDATSFHTKARQETNVTITVRVPHSTARGIAKIVQSGKFPGLETNSDAIRDGMWRWLRWIATVTEDEGMAEQLDLQRSHWRMESELAKKEQLANTVETATRILEGEGCGEKTRRMVLTELSDLALKTEDSTLRKRIIELVAKHQ